MLIASLSVLVNAGTPVDSSSAWRNAPDICKPALTAMEFDFTWLEKSGLAFEGRYDVRSFVTSEPGRARDASGDNAFSELRTPITERGTFSYACDANVERVDFRPTELVPEEFYSRAWSRVVGTSYGFWTREGQGFILRDGQVAAIHEGETLKTVDVDPAVLSPHRFYDFWLRAPWSAFRRQRHIDTGGADFNPAIEPAVDGDNFGKGEADDVLLLARFEKGNPDPKYLQDFKFWRLSRSTHWKPHVITFQENNGATVAQLTLTDWREFPMPRSPRGSIELPCNISIDYYANKHPRRLVATHTVSIEAVRAVSPTDLQQPKLTGQERSFLSVQPDSSVMRQVHESRVAEIAVRTSSQRVGGRFLWLGAACTAAIAILAAAWLRKHHTRGA